MLDPVMVAKSGDRLLVPEAVESLKSRLLPLATVITPNLPEAAVLLGRDEDIGTDDMEAVAHALQALGARAVLLKGGHLAASESPDYLFDDAGLEVFTAARSETGNTHGTGCTLSSAIAALLARGHDLRAAVRGAKAYVTAAIRAADTLQIGTGHGPVHHFHEFWSPPE